MHVSSLSYFLLQAPLEKCLGNAYLATHFSGQKRQAIQRQKVFYYVPIVETLKCILSKDEIVSEINSSPLESDGLIRDFRDGSIIQNNNAFTENHQQLQIIAYFDDVEVCNPLGSYTKKHKLSCLFFSLGNICPRKRSTLKAIYLVAVAKYEDVTSYGMDQFLKPFVDEMETLATEGVEIQEPFNIRYYGSLIAILADSLAAHTIGGFKQSMSFALRICRSCMATTDQIQTGFTENCFVVRTPEMHRRQCHEIESSEALHDHYSTNYGINRASTLDSVANFSVVNNLPHDIMHDMFEGVLPYELKLYLQYCVEKKYFSIQELNSRIRSFDYGYSELSSKPSEIDVRVSRGGSDMKIRQSASQMMVLAHIFPCL